MSTGSQTRKCLPWGPESSCPSSPDSWYDNHLFHQLGISQESKHVHSYNLSHSTFGFQNTVYEKFLIVFCRQESWGSKRQQLTQSPRVMLPGLEASFPNSQARLTPGSDSISSDFAFNSTLHIAPHWPFSQDWPCMAPDLISCQSMPAMMLVELGAGIGTPILAQESLLLTQTIKYYDLSAGTTS